VKFIIALMVQEVKTLSSIVKTRSKRLIPNEKKATRLSPWAAVHSTVAKSFTLVVTVAWLLKPC
jgi:hypothetical protein